MNLDIAAHRMALRQTDSLGVAQLLVVKQRVDVEMEELRQRAISGSAAGEVLTQRAIESVEAAVEALPDVNRVFDKTV